MIGEADTIGKADIIGIIVVQNNNWEEALSLVPS